MSNHDIASQIKEDLEIFGPTWRSSFAFDIKRTMISKGLKNIDLAERLQVSEANVSRMLRGDQNFKIETMYLLAAAVGEKLNIFVGDRKESPKVQVIDYFENHEPVEFRGKYTELRLKAMSHRPNRTPHDMEVANESCVAFG